LLKHFGGVSPTCFGLPIKPSSGGAYAVLCAVTKSDSVDVRSLIVCVVRGCMSMSSVCVCVCPELFSGWCLFMECFVTCHVTFIIVKVHRFSYKLAVFIIIIIIIF